MRACDNTGVEPMSQVETDPLGRTRIISTSQVETDPLGRTIGGGANQADALEGLNGNIVDLGPAERLGSSPWPGDSVSAVYPSPPNDIPSVSTRARAHYGTDTMKDGPVATIKEAKRSLPSRVQVASNSTEETPQPVQVSPISRYSGDISIIGGRLNEKLSACKGQVDSYLVYWWYTL